MSEQALPAAEEVMARLAHLAALMDPLPEPVRAAARASFSWAGVESELAQLVYDSAAEDRALAGVRGHAGRHLSFEAPGLTVECEVGGGRLVGQLVPPQVARIEVCRPEGSFVVDSDHLGRFGTEPVASGPLRLRVRVGDAASGGQTATEWVAI